LKLTKEQKNELREWRESKTGQPQTQQHPPKRARKNSFNKRQVASIVNKRIKWELNKIQKHPQDEEQEEGGKAFIMSLVEEALEKKQAQLSSTEAQAPPTPATLNSILRRAKNGGKK
jgi:hypothetical protein